MGRELFHERRRLGVEILLRHRSLGNQHQWEYRIAVALLPSNGLQLKPHHAEVALVIDGEESAKRFLTEVARIIEAPVAVQRRDRRHLRFIQLKIEELLVLS